jgi:hypothetical protein
MNNGIDLVALATEITRQKTEKTDYLVANSAIKMVSDAGIDGNKPNIEMQIEGVDNFSITEHTHGQIGANLKIPAAYYSKMLESAPELLVNNVNHWLDKKPNEKRMVRTLDGGARAFLSDRYRRIDNEMIAEAVLPVLFENQTDIKSCAITDKKMYIKALFPRIQGEVKVGDVVQSGVAISNSEIGGGRVLVQPLIYRLVCTNGMISSSACDFQFNRTHLGRKMDIGDAFEIFRDETIIADDKAFMLKIADVVRASMNPAIFAGLLDSMKKAADSEKSNSPMITVERMGAAFGIREHERQGVLENLIRGQDYSQWGALNAVTELANHNKSYERSTELEAIGGSILDLSPSQWHELAYYDKAA